MRNIFCALSMGVTSIPYNNNFMSLVESKVYDENFFMVLKFNKVLGREVVVEPDHVVLKLGWVNFILGILMIALRRDAVININNPLFGVLFPFFLVVRMVGVAIIYTQHTPFSHLGFKNRFFCYLCFGLAVQLHCVSRVVKFQTPKLFRKKTVLLYNSVPMPLVVPPHVGEKERALVSVGRLVDLKGWRDFIDFASKHHDSFSKFRWVGSGPREVMVRQVLELEAHKDKIDFLGGVDRDAVHHILNNSRSYVSFSKWEGFGVSVVEALFYCDFVYLSSIPAHAELVHLIGSGSLFSDRAELYAAILTDSGRVGAGSVSKLNKRRDRIRFLFSSTRYSRLYKRLSASVV